MEDPEDLTEFGKWELERMYGPPEERDRKRAAYFKQLRATYSEEEIREALEALATVPDFIPADRYRLQTNANTPLEELLEPAGIVWFRIVRLTKRGDRLTVVVSHGIPMAARGEYLTFRRMPNGLVHLPEKSGLYSVS